MVYYKCAAYDFGTTRPVAMLEHMTVRRLRKLFIRARWSSTFRANLRMRSTWSLWHIAVARSQPAHADCLR